MKQQKTILFVMIMIILLSLSACIGQGRVAEPSSSQSTSNSTPQPGGTTPNTEKAVAPETNPVGDIPDNQVFVRYSSPSGGYSLDAPEGWSRTNQGTDVRFIDKFDGVSVTLASTPSAPTINSVTQNEANLLAQSERAFKLSAINSLSLPNGTVIQIKATANSDPDSVTGKQVRLEEEFYLFYQNGNLATLKLWAPQGADNVDQWKRISESFSWK